MNRAPKTAAAYDAATLALAEREERRKHLGASVIGHKCDRKIWYQFRWAFTGNPHEPRLLRLFRRGHREEPEFLRYLNAIPGVEVWDAGDCGQYKEMLRISDVDGHFGGTPDGVISQLPDFPGEPALLEFKTFNDDQFQKLKADGVMTAKWEYFVQIQLYLDKHQLKRCLFMGVNKNDDELYLEIVSSNAPVAADAIERARKIIYATEPPARINESPGYWLCKFCDYQKLCHFADIPDINCRTCAYASVGPAGSWLCDKSRAEIAGQAGCDQHVFDPRFFTDGIAKVEVVDGGDDFIKVRYPLGDGKTMETETWGPKHRNSQDLVRHGFVPF